MQVFSAAAGHFMPPGFPVQSGAVRTLSQVMSSKIALTLPRNANRQYASRGFRSFGSLNLFSKRNGDGRGDSGEHALPWDEVEAQRPLAPDPYDGTYQMPRGAPDARNLSRQHFHQFMQGKPQRFSKEFKVAMMGISLTAFGIGVTLLTAYVMRPDDFEWVEEERKLIQEAKERIQRRIDSTNHAEGKGN